MLSPPRRMCSPTLMRSSSNVPSAVGNGNQAEIGGAAADITDQDDVTRTDQRTPLPTCLRDPGVERCLRLFKQGDFAKTGGLRCFGGQTLRNRIERCRNRQDNLSFRKVPVPPLHASSIEKRVLQVRKVSPRALKGRELFVLDIRSPRKRLMPGVDMRVGEPRFGGGDETIGNKRAMVASEMAGYRGILEPVFPRKRKRVLRIFVTVGDVQRGGQRWFLADLIWSNYLGNFQYLGLIGLQIGERDRAVRCTKVDAKTETCGS